MIAGKHLFYFSVLDDAVDLTFDRVGHDRTVDFGLTRLVSRVWSPLMTPNTRDQTVLSPDQNMTDIFSDTASISAYFDERG